MRRAAMGAKDTAAAAAAPHTQPPGASTAAADSPRTGGGVVLDAQVDVLLDAEAEVAGLAEVGSLELVLLHLEAALEQVLRLLAADLRRESGRGREREHVQHQQHQQHPSPATTRTHVQRATTRPHRERGPAALAGAHGPSCRPPTRRRRTGRCLAATRPARAAPQHTRSANTTVPARPDAQAAENGARHFTWGQGAAGVQLRPASQRTVTWHAIFSLRRMPNCLTV